MKSKCPSWRGKAPVRPRCQGRGVGVHRSEAQSLDRRSGRIRRRVGQEGQLREGAFVARRSNPYRSLFAESRKRNRRSKLSSAESTVITYRKLIRYVSRNGETVSKARDYIAKLAASGRYHFAAEEMRKVLGVSRDAAKLALYRLGKRGLVASPARGFYIIVPPEYKRLGSLPADQFLPGLMEWRKTRYYAGLLSAAQYHGAGHQRPQEFQVMVEKNLRPIECGSVRVSFIARKKVRAVPVQSFNTPRGTISVSTVEATAVDLAGYPHHAGGFDQVATILVELAEKIEPKRLVAAAKTAPLPWAQRLGYLLERVGAKEQASLLKTYVEENARDWTALVPGARRARARRADDWLLYVNAEVEPEA